MAENCFKCKRALSASEKDQEPPTIISCGTDSCTKKCHRTCANIADDAVVEAIQKNLVIYNCGECKDRHKILMGKINAMEEKLNKVCMGINQLQSRIFQQNSMAACGGGGVGGSGNDGKKLNNSINNNNHNNNNNNNQLNNSMVVVGCNVNTDNKLKVVCDYGRWVQVGKFATQTTEEDIIDYVADELKITKNLVKCTKLVKNDANLAQLSYCKFKISVPDYRFNDLFNETVWPSGVMVSPFTPRSQIQTKFNFSLNNR